MNREEYAKSKQVLLDHLKNDPIITKSYKLNKYCKISIGTTLNTKDMFILRPKDIIKIIWNFKDSHNPKCLKMIIDNKEIDVYWNNTRINIWLSKNTEHLL